MIQTIKAILKLFIEDIDTGNSNITEAELLEILETLARINSKELNKTQAAEYIGKCKATFDNYVDKGLIPKGKKYPGSNELRWNKYDLNKFLENDVV